MDCTGTQFKRRHSPRRRRLAGLGRAGEPIMKTSFGKCERSQNFAGKHGTIYCFHIRRRVLRSWMQFVNPLSGERRASREIARRARAAAGNLADCQRSVFLLLANKLTDQFLSRERPLWPTDSGARDRNVCVAADHKYYWIVLCIGSITR